MIATIQKAENEFQATATFTRTLPHSVKEVWEMLTVNEKLQEWFSELSIENLRKGGIIKFDMQDGTFEEMEILEVEHESILEFTWAEDVVRFELSPQTDGCRLIFIEKITTITDHTPKDLAGWHVCLDVIEALLDGRKIESRKAEWEKVYPKYVEVLNNIS